jgi:2-polyprenyl-3-methyl-5-hydroxy-6-metoxy-1,4-benzoquinol methylase
MQGDERFTDLSVGDEFFVRYVPQSRYFQAQELGVHGSAAGAELCAMLNAERAVLLERVLTTSMIAERVQPIEMGRGVQPVGVYDVDYHVGRLHDRQLVYRLQRRTDEVEGALRRHVDGRLQTIVDVGTADGLMLEKLHRSLGPLRYIGVDYSLALLRTTELDGVDKLQADGMALPVGHGMADAVIATAIIEHVPDGRGLLRECARVLRPGGLIVITTPAPLMERIATRVGLLKDAGHHETLDLRTLESMLKSCGFDVLEARKFMFSPVGFPGEKAIERTLGPVGLSAVMANQLVVARRQEQGGT